MDIMGNLGFWSGFSTILTMIFFGGVVAWAWSAKRKDVFDKMSSFTLDDDDVIIKDKD